MNTPVYEAANTLAKVGRDRLRADPELYTEVIWLAEALKETKPLQANELVAMICGVALGLGLAISEQQIEEVGGIDKFIAIGEEHGPEAMLKAYAEARAQ